MSTNEQFAKACNRLDEGQVGRILVSYMQIAGRSPFIETKMYGKDNFSDRNGSFDMYIRDEEMNANEWRQYGKSVKASNKIHTLALSTTGVSYYQSIRSP